MHLVSRPNSWLKEAQGLAHQIVTVIENNLGKVFKGKPGKEEVRCEKFDRTTSVVLKTLSLRFYRTFSKAEWGHRTFAVRSNLC